MIISTVLISGFLQEIKHWWSGIDYFVEFMEEVADLIYFIKQTLRDQDIKINWVPKED